MKIRAYITHKAKERITDCQDRFAVNKETKIVAVSDGVSQSIFPDYWAELLVNHYSQFGTLTNDERINLCDLWTQKVRKYIDDEKAKGNNPWRTESNLDEGLSAGATLCGVKFEDTDKWYCDIIGDSCLIKVDADNDIEILSSEDKKFDNEPDYLDSHPNKKGRGQFVNYHGTISESKKLILVSDPFSDFFYKHKSEAPQLIQQILNINTHEDFTFLVDDWRLKGMKGDDSTIVIVEWDNSSEFNIAYMDEIEAMIEKENQIQINCLQTETPINSHIDLKEGQTVELSPDYLSKEEITKDSQDFSSKETTDVKDYEDMIAELKDKLKSDIPQFVENYIITEVRQKKIIGCKSIINFVLSKNKKKENELACLLESVLNTFVNTI